MASNPDCVYCGSGVQRSRRVGGEHIIQKAIGGTKTIQGVCGTCNNQHLSVLDKELVSRSYLSLVALKHLSKKFDRCWDVDRDLDNMLLEAQPDPEFSCAKLWPQFIFAPDRPQLRADSEEYEEIGAEEYARIFLEHVEGAFKAHSSKSRGKRSPLVLEHVEPIPDGYSYPPRIYAERSIKDFHSKMHFKCRYATREDKAVLMEKLGELNPKFPFASEDTVLGDPKPTLNFHFDGMLVIRALTKIGINLLVDTCSRTAVDCHSFRDAVRFVKYGLTRRGRRVINRCGFAEHRDFHALGCPPGSHKFRLVYYRGSHLWVLYCSFFGGDINARTEFPGQSQELWSTMDITVPVDSKNWAYKEYSGIVDFPTRVRSDENLDAIIRSLPPGSVQSARMRLGRQPIRF